MNEVGPGPDKERNLQPADAQLVKLLFDAGKLSEQDFKHIIAEQQAHSLRFGEAAMRLGLIGDQDLFCALARQVVSQSFQERDLKRWPELVAVTSPFSSQMQSLRYLRSQLMLRWFGGQRRLMAVSGAGPDVGCTWLTANLAVVFSQLGERTLLIDTDMRVPRLHELFGLDNSTGLSGILANRNSVSQTVNHLDALGNLSVICSGTPPPNPQELLSRSMFNELIEQVHDQYDIVLFDTPPALLSPDAQIVAARVGASLIVVQKDVTRLADLKKVKDLYDTAGVEIAGVVFLDGKCQ